MKATGMKTSMHEKMDAARRFFSKRASAASKSDEREFYRELEDLAGSVEELASLQEHSKIQLEELRHAVGLHVGRTGPAAHAQRAK